MTLKTKEEILDVLRLFDFDSPPDEAPEDFCLEVDLGELFISQRGGDLVVAINCNDWFHYACADCVEIEHEDVPTILEIWQELKDRIGQTAAQQWTLEVFAGRKRKLAPLKARLLKMNQESPVKSAIARVLAEAGPSVV